jgi:hypothetical protein
MKKEDYELKVKSMIKEVLSRDKIQDDTAKYVGEFLYYHNRIDNCLGNLLFSLVPEMKFEEIEVRDFKFKLKLALVQSLTPNQDKLAFFRLLSKVNKIRNDFAHEDPLEIDHLKNNQALLNLFHESFDLGKELKNKIDKLKKDSIAMTSTIASATCLYLEVLVESEIIGKREESTLKTMELIRNYTGLYVRRRFSILAYQFQTGKKSGEAPEEFKLNTDFNDIIIKFKELVSGIFNS